MIGNEQMYKEAYGYASRLFKSLAPQCEPLPDLMGVLTQIDNWCVGHREQVSKPEEEINNSLPI